MHIDSQKCVNLYILGGGVFLLFKTFQITLISLVWRPLLENEVKMQRPRPSL